MTESKLGKVTEVDVVRGVASVSFENGGTTAFVPSAVFFSGRPARLPRPGDRVRVQLRAAEDGPDIVLAARLVDG